MHLNAYCPGCGGGEGNQVQKAACAVRLFEETAKQCGLVLKLRKKPKGMVGTAG